jgi:hypothetical protein
VSDTPRTDEFEKHCCWSYHITGNCWDFARQLERENAALRRLAAHRAVVIEHQMITTSAHQITRFTDEDESIWDERVQRFMDADRAIINAACKEGGAP